MKNFLTILFAALVLAFYPGTGFCADEPGPPVGKPGAGEGAQPGPPVGGRGASQTGAQPAPPSATIVPEIKVAGTPGGSAKGTGLPSGGGFFTGNYEVGDAANGIGFSRHNLGRYGGKTREAKNFEICVFCHTPHTPSKKESPIWSGKESASTNYMAYGTSVISVKRSTVGLGSPSLACLSCHDGMAAPDSVANSPGKRRVAPAETLGAWGFPLTEDKVSPSVVNTRLLLAPLSTDDHPVNVLFRGGKVASLRPRNTIISQINLSSGLGGLRGIKVKNRLSQPNLWSIKGYISDTASIGDLLRDGRIECSSCHDPHFNNKSWREVSGSFRDWEDMDGLFLRRIGGNTGSGVCRTCHQK